jgi:hypothetical protein
LKIDVAFKTLSIKIQKAGDPDQYPNEICFLQNKLELSLNVINTPARLLRK